MSSLIFLVRRIRTSKIPPVFAFFSRQRITWRSHRFLLTDATRQHPLWHNKPFERRNFIKSKPPAVKWFKMVSNNKRLLLSFNYLYVVFLGKDDFVLTTTKIGGTKV